MDYGERIVKKNPPIPSGKFTLDTNCIIDLEENRPNAEYVRHLINAWENGRIELAVVAVSASENQMDGFPSRSFTTFEAKLSTVGLAGVHHLLPMAYWDVFYWDHALWVDDETEKLESKIWAALFPKITATPPENHEENSQWRNQLCDVQVAWSCIHHKWGVLVTSDKNFHVRKCELVELGLQDLVFPADAVLLCMP